MQQPSASSLSHTPKQTCISRKKKQKKTKLLKLPSNRGLIRKALRLHTASLTPSPTSTALFYSIISPAVVISPAPSPRSRRDAGVVFFCRRCACGLLSSVSHAQTHTHACPRGRSTAPPSSFSSLLTNFTEHCHVS